jgi:hypothetical protein
VLPEAARLMQACSSKLVSYWPGMFQSNVSHAVDSLLHLSLRVARILV